jgi:hypothetical protein
MKKFKVAINMKNGEQLSFRISATDIESLFREIHNTTSVEKHDWAVFGMQYLVNISDVSHFHCAEIVEGKFDE